MTKEEKIKLIKVFKLMLVNKRYFNSGLCGWLSTLGCTDLITIDEHILARDYLTYKAPNTIITNTGFWWKKGIIEPRIKWLRYHIWKLETPWYKKIFNIKIWIKKV